MNNTNQPIINRVDTRNLLRVKKNNNKKSGAVLEFIFF